MIEIENIENAEEAAKATRSTLYRLLSESMKYPGTEFVEIIKDGTFFDGIQRVAEALPYSLEVDSDGLAGGPLPEMDQEDFEAEYIRVFDVGAGGPPCPLREGLYHGNRMAVMEELVRFYNHFGLSTTKGEERELPDNLSTELEFMHYLTFKEVIALQHNQDPTPYLRAERDFLERHLAKFLTLLLERLDDFIAKGYGQVNQPVLKFYRTLLGFANAYAHRDLEHATAKANEAP